MLKRKDINMPEGSITKGIGVIPIIIINVTIFLFNIIDIVVLKLFDDAADAIQECTVWIALIACLLIGVFSWSTVIIARHIGRKDPARVDRTMHTYIVISFIACIALTIFGVARTGNFLMWTNCPAKLLPNSVLYFRMYFVGFPLLIVYNFCATVLCASGDSRRPINFLIIGSTVKVLSNLVFTGAFQMGVVGVTFATILSWCVFATLALIPTVKKFKKAV